MIYLLMLLQLTLDLAVLGGLGLLLENSELFKGGAAFIATGAIFLMMSVNWMMKFGKEETTHG